MGSSVRPHFEIMSRGSYILLLILAAEIPVMMLVAIWLCPMLTLMLMTQFDSSGPSWVQLFFFFWPQYVFPLGMTFLESGDRVGFAVDLTLWLAVIVAYSMLCYRLRFSLQICAALVTIVGITGLKHLAICLYGWEFYLDGPQR